jgi:hypothetical protein
MALRVTGSVAELVEQRPFKPKPYLTAFLENCVLAHKKQYFLSVPERQPKVKRTSLARALNLRLVRSVYSTETKNKKTAITQNKPLTQKPETDLAAYLEDYRDLAWLTEHWRAIPEAAQNVCG